MSCHLSKTLIWIKVVSQYKQKNENIELSIIKNNSINKNTNTIMYLFR